jgi:DNA-binding PadR family transcriptional regulator
MTGKRHHHRPPGIRSRNRRRLSSGAWEVRARIERFIEPAILLLLRDGPAHGYELADGLGSYESDDRIDFGNLYRLLHRLEEEGILTSEWDHDAPGRSKRRYDLTPDGKLLLDTWAGALERANTQIDRFLQGYRSP